MVVLRIRSNHSLLSGASSLDQILSKAKRLGFGALALTDENNLYGAVPFFKKACQAGIRPILGAVVSHMGREAVLLVKSRVGYENLCKVLSRRHLDNCFSLPGTILEHQAGLFVLTPDPLLAESLADAMDKKQLWMEILRPSAGTIPESSIVAAARKLGIGVIASSDIYFAEPGDAVLYQMLSAIRLNLPFLEVCKNTYFSSATYLRSPGELSRLYSDIPEALTNAASLAPECSFDLLDRQTVFPKTSANSGQNLYHDVLTGARGRYGKINSEVKTRLDHEYKVITTLGFTDYFLVVADIVKHARSLGTPVAGRGSGASSLVSYCLGITHVDPIRYKLPFARFLNEGRTDYPDLDVDFCWRLRDKVIDYVYKKYGSDHVAMVSTHATMQYRLAFRAVAKAFGFSTAQITQLLKRLHNGLPRKYWGSLPADPAIVERIIGLARKCEGFPHHLSIHSGGVVITPDLLANHVPLQRAPKGIVVTQFEKDAIETIGLVKLDLLGNRSLSTVSATIRLVRETRAETLDPDALPEQDNAVSAILADAHTLGVNQLESPAMRRLLRQIRPTNVEELMRVLALIRPGAASLGMKDAFIRRIRKLEAVPKIDPRLDAVLRDSFGIMLYEDDALFVASLLAGLPVEQADRFRRRIAKCRTDEERRELSRRFLGYCVSNGVEPEMAKDLWGQMAKFNSYSFCRAHAASYARIAWVSAYLKAYYPAEFWVAALNNNDGMYEKWVYVEEAKRTGVNVLGPCVNESVDEFSLEHGAIRTGLGQIRGLSGSARESIFRNRPFAGVIDFIARTTLREEEVASVIRVGGLNVLGIPRQPLLDQLAVLFKQAKGFRGASLLFSLPDPHFPGESMKVVSETERLRDEWNLLSLSTVRHPVSYMRPALIREDILPSHLMSGRVGLSMRVCGVIAAARTARTRKGETVCLMTLSDEDGLFDLTLSPDIYSKHQQELVEQGAGVIWSSGKVESRYDALSVAVQGIGYLGRAV